MSRSTDWGPHPASTFPIFTFSWALVIVFGMSSESMSHTPLAVLVCLTGAYAMLRPTSPHALAAVASAYVAHWMIDDYRHAFVHTWFDFWGCVLILIGLAISFDKDSTRWREAFVMRAGPAAVAYAAICFFAAGFAKINVDYMRPETSCAVVFYAWQRTMPPYSWILPTGPIGEWLGMLGTVFAECVAPLLWLHHRTRKIGFFLGFLLMFLLGTNAYARYYVFTGPFIALITLGLDWRIPVKLLEGLHLERASRWGPIAAVLAYGLVLAMTVGTEGPGLVNRHFAARTLFVFFALFIAISALLTTPIRFGPVWRGTPWHKLAWSVVLFILIFESLPYFGMRSGRNFTMAANFVLDEGYSNHLIVTRPLPLPIDKASWGKTFSLRVGKSRERVVDCGKRRPGDKKKPSPKKKRVK